MKRLALIGTKEFADQIINYAEETNEFEFVGYFDNIEKKGTIVRGKPVIGTVDEAVEAYKNNLFDCVFIGVGYTRFDLRESFYNTLKGKVPFANIIMPGVQIGKDVKLGEGIFIGSNSKIGNYTTIGDNVFMHGSTFIAHDNFIKSHTYISGRFDTAGFVTIGERCFCGIRVCIADHISICDDVWIGLGCIVGKNITKPGKYMTSAAKLYKID